MTTQEKADQLSQSVKVGDSFQMYGYTMRVKRVSPFGCILGANEFYTWTELQRYITIGAIKPATKS